ncbi:MAG TPA: TetR/AcrR family transcriptional regulator [Spirochaetes bacterium]|nr:TetR/AcrR family transcriptional regulator [Spirochaetota bacterium]
MLLTEDKGKKKEKPSTREKVLRAALKEFAECGFAGARVDRIAAKARVNKAMIYYHFKSKEALYENIIKEITGAIYGHVREAAAEGADPLEQIYSVINKYISLIAVIDRDIFRTLLREIAGGGRYFRKIAVPSLILPVITLLEPVIRAAIEQGKIKDLNPYYTFLQIIGGIIFFNIIRIPMEGTEMEKLVFTGDYVEEYRKNLIRILKTGIEKKETE